MKKPTLLSNSRGAGKKTLAFQGGSYSLMLTAVVLALLIVVNILVSVLPTSLTKYNISSAKLSSITSNTKAVVNALQEDVTIYWIVQADQEDQIIENLLGKYQITGEEYTALMAAAYDDLRHQEVLPVDFEEMTQLDITLDGESYAIAAQGGEDDRTYLLGDEEVDLDDVIYAMECLTADSFTDQSPTGKEEIRLTLTSSRASVGTVEVALFRQDGSFCLAQVNGQSVSLIPRDQVVDLMEAVNAIVLG